MRPSSLSRRAACSVMRACAARILGRQRRGPQRGARRGARRARLQRVQAVAVGGRPAAPDVRRLAQRAVARAGHVAEHAVEAHGLALRRALPGASARRAYRCAGPARRRGAAGPARRRGARLCVADGGEDGGVVVGHDERGAGHALGVVREQVAALRVGVVGDDKACVGGARACPAARRGGAQRARRGGGRRRTGGQRVTLVQHLQDLHRLGAGRGARVQHLRGPSARWAGDTRGWGEAAGPAAGAPGARAARPAAAPAPWTRPGNAGRG